RVVGEIRARGGHARRSSKSTRNVGKLLKDAVGQCARRAVIIESASEATIKDLDSGEQVSCAIESIAATVT
ncbi:MAG: hypothetical protein KDA28_02310, partial [Phycisphaerales bacterium]|nr:hypothetical protein [Phycisphaerales bacterium]